MSLRIVLADDHQMVRQAIKAALTQVGLDVVGEASTGKEAIDQCFALQPDVAVLDITMPQLSGIDAAREILKSCPETKIVVLTMHTHDKYVQKALGLGIKGYVLKSNTSDELAAAIYAVARGETYVSLFTPSIANLQRMERTQADPLGVREQQVLRLIAEGKNSKEIGQVLNVSEKTVCAHRANIMRKLGIQDTASLVRYSVGHELVEEL